MPVCGQKIGKNERGCDVRTFILADQGPTSKKGGADLLEKSPITTEKDLIT